MASALVVLARWRWEDRYEPRLQLRALVLKTATTGTASAAAPATKTGRPGCSRPTTAPWAPSCRTAPIAPRKGLRRGPLARARRKALTQVRKGMGKAYADKSPNGINRDYVRNILGEKRERYRAALAKLAAEEGARP